MLILAAYWGEGEQLTAQREGRKEGVGRGRRQKNIGEGKVHG